jgi:hypothetical protein
MFMVQYPRSYGFTHLCASRSEDLIVTSLVQTCFNPAHTSTPRGAHSPCCCKQRNRLLNHIAISSCQVLSYGFKSEPIPKWQHCSGLEHATLWLRVGFANHCATIAEYCVYSMCLFLHRRKYDVVFNGKSFLRTSLFVELSSFCCLLRC